MGSGADKCLSCISPARFVNRLWSGTTHPLEWGTCTLKTLTHKTFTVIVDNIKAETDRTKYQSTSTPFGTTTLPFNNLIDGIAKAYELGAEY